MAHDKDIDLARVDEIVHSLGREPAQLIPILTAVQEVFDYLPQTALDRICRITDIPPARLFGVATFYSHFRLQPAGVHQVKVCVGTACHVKGAETVYTAFLRQLGIPDGGDTDADRLFTVRKVACLGCCMLAPAVQIDRTTYAHLTPERVPAVLRDFLESQRQATAVARGGAHPQRARGEVRLCRCTSCAAAGADALWTALDHAARRLDLPVACKSVGCTGISFEAPLLEVVAPDGSAFRYARVSSQDAEEILLRHFRPARLHHRIAESAVSLLERIVPEQEGDAAVRYSPHVRDVMRTPYWERQRHVVLEHAGEIEPLDIDEYVQRGGFETLDRCRNSFTPEDIIAQITQSGLRGRGGAGYGTGLKWQSVRQAAGETRYVVCNGDEGDPGSFMDRMILESFPFRVIEGMAIAALAVGAREGYLYIRGEYPLAVERVRSAIRICRERGYTGPTGATALELHVAEGAGAFVCGEETALLAAIEGRRGMPRVRPPFPSDHGLWGQPTLVNNVETFAAVPWILSRGAEALRALGTHGSPGTKTFALAGKIVKGGLIEVPMGTTLGEIVNELGGGIQDGKTFKAVQIGGPSGGCVPASLADTPIDFDALQGIGAIMGSGGLVVLDESDCMVDIARYFLSFTQQESCGKCTYCRVGTKRLLEILERLCAGEGKQQDLSELETLSEGIRRGSLCGLGRTAPNPVLSTLRHFRNEYQAHVDGRCPARRCRELIHYEITSDCIGCTRCAQRCPVDAIAFRPHEQHEIDTELCIRCDTCRQVCPSDAVIVTDRKPVENS